jgi:transposase
MVNRKISSDIKDCALRLWELGWDPDIILESLAISRASLYRWQNIFLEHGSVTKPRSPLLGRPQIIVRAVMTAIKEVYHNEADAYLDEIVWWLAIHHDIIISRSALQANLRDAGLTRKLLHKIAQERDEEMRAEFMETVRDHSGGRGDEFVFLDEMSKNDHDTARRYGLAMRGQRAEFVDNFVRGDRYSLVAAITTQGYIATRVIPGSYDSVEFFDFVAEQVVSQYYLQSECFIVQCSLQLPQMNEYPGHRSILILDNCRIHHNAALVDLVNAAGEFMKYTHLSYCVTRCLLGCLILYLPPYSPDLNPIEESFSARM